MIHVILYVFSWYIALSLVAWVLGSLSSLLVILNWYVDKDNITIELFPFHFIMQNEEGDMKWSISKSAIKSFSWPKYPYRILINLGKTIEF